jgi:hypothetical protein
MTDVKYYIYPGVLSTIYSTLLSKNNIIYGILVGKRYYADNFIVQDKHELKQEKLCFTHIQTVDFEFVRESGNVDEDLFKKLLKKDQIIGVFLAYYQFSTFPSLKIQAIKSSLIDLSKKIGFQNENVFLSLSSMKNNKSALNSHTFKVNFLNKSNSPLLNNDKDRMSKDKDNKEGTQSIEILDIGKSKYKYLTEVCQFAEEFRQINKDSINLVLKEKMIIENKQRLFNELKIPEIDSKLILEKKKYVALLKELKSYEN